MAQVDLIQITDTGRVRQHNEDAIGSWPSEDGLLFAVADGLGGENAGEVASRLALEVLEREYRESPGQWPTAKKLRRALQEANLRIYNMGITVPELRGMGTTVTASAIVGASLVAAHVGDCRLFRLRDGKLSQLTKDHTWVAEQVQFGLLTPNQAVSHPRRHMLTRSLGKELIVAVDVVSSDVRAGDLLLQCSDGLHTHVAEPDLLAVLRENEPETACRSLLERALDAGGADNLSVQIAVVTSCSPPPQRSWWQRLRPAR